MLQASLVTLPSSRSDGAMDRDERFYMAQRLEVGFSPLTVRGGTSPHDEDSRRQLGIESQENSILTGGRAEDMTFDKILKLLGGEHREAGHVPGGARLSYPACSLEPSSVPCRSSTGDTLRDEESHGPRVERKS